MLCLVYHPIHFVALDLMHNIYLGTGKHMLSTWIELGFLSKQNLVKIDNKLHQFSVPDNVGRLPTSIISNYKRFKVSQWSSWITVFSAIVLKDILPDQHYQCWLLFVRACALLTQRILRTSDINTADTLLELFCKRVEFYIEMPFALQTCTYIYI